MTTIEEQLRAEIEAVMEQEAVGEKRRAIVKSVAHSSAMEGMPLSENMMGMLHAVADGTMTTEEVRAKLNAKYRR